MNVEAIAHLDVFPFLASLWERRDLFDTVTLRQAAPGSPHHDTRAIFLRVPFVPGGADVQAIARAWFDDVEHLDCPLMLDWPEAKNLLAEVVESIPGACEPPFNRAGSRIAKVMIVSLKPGGYVDWHTDQGAYAKVHQRFHVALTTNPRAYLFSGTQQAHLAAGVLASFNNHTLHSAVNLGGSERIHMIVDVRSDALEYGSGAHG